MAQILASFTETQENVSVQRGDLGFFVETQNAGSDNAFVVNNQQPILIGPIVNITRTGGFIGILFELQGDYWVGNGDNFGDNLPPQNSFLMFAKNNSVNVASILGYYGVARFKNNSLNKAELYAASCEIAESSK
jgi:hypothetical protein